MGIFKKVGGAAAGATGGAMLGAIAGGAVGSLFGPVGTVVGAKAGAWFLGAGGAVTGYNEPEKGVEMAAHMIQHKMKG